MSKSCTVSINDERFLAKRGDVLLDAALANGIDIPHDCRSGHCGSCQVRITDGLALSGDGIAQGMVRACQARVLTDIAVLVEPVPDAVTTRGVITGLRPLARDIMEVRIHLAKPVTYLPGQYYKFQFAGFPARCFSPTPPMEPAQDGNAIRLHIRMIPEGKVSSTIGNRIQKGHPVKLKGPFGAAYFRPRGTGRLVMVSSGTGFAPIWAITKAAIDENPHRPIALVLGARGMDGLYMGGAVQALQGKRNIAVIPVVDKLQIGAAKMLREGRPTSHIPPLIADDTVYACGSPPMVEAVRAIAEAAGATFYADPFVPQGDEDQEGFIAQMLNRVSNLKVPLPRLGGPAAVARLERPKS